MQILGVSSSGGMAGNAHSATQSIRFGVKDVQERMRSQTRELKLREREDEMIKNLQESIAQVSNSDVSQDIKDAKIKNLSEQIQGIYDNRNEREIQAREAEIQKQKEALEETKRKHEEAADKQGSANLSEEDAIAREDIEGMVKLGVSHDGISALKKTKASMSSEAEQLKRDIENDAKRGGVSAEGDFRVRQYEKLTAGIKSIEGSIDSELKELNKDISHLVKSKTENVNEPALEEKPKETENAAETEKKQENQQEKNSDI